MSEQCVLFTKTHALDHSKQVYTSFGNTHKQEQTNVTENINHFAYCT